ncbi:hypothetical protein CN918_26570 [Priestia megaterium]|nr:hypothetical protein CN918_26570 [Priestia megaterium]
MIWLTIPYLFTVVFSLWLFRKAYTMEYYRIQRYQPLSVYITSFLICLIPLFNILQSYFDYHYEQKRATNRTHFMEHFVRACFVEKSNKKGA